MTTNHKNTLAPPLLNVNNSTSDSEEFSSDNSSTPNELIDDKSDAKTYYQSKNSSLLALGIASKIDFHSSLLEEATTDAQETPMRNNKTPRRLGYAPSEDQGYFTS